MRTEKGYDDDDDDDDEDDDDSVTVPTRNSNTELEVSLPFTCVPSYAVNDTVFEIHLLQTRCLPLSTL